MTNSNPADVAAQGQISRVLRKREKMREKARKGRNTATTLSSKVNLNLGLSETSLSHSLALK